MIIVHS